MTALHEVHPSLLFEGRGVLPALPKSSSAALRLAKGINRPRLSYTLLAKFHSVSGTLTLACQDRCSLLCALGAWLCVVALDRLGGCTLFI